jgi:hypothetical protein
MGSVHARGDTFLTFGLKALTETNTSRLATGMNHPHDDYRDKLRSLLGEKPAPAPLLSPRIAHGLIQEFNSLKPGGNNVSQKS